MKLYHLIQHIQLPTFKIWKNINLKHLGRWGITHDDNVIDKKIDFSNIDHSWECDMKKIESKLDKPLNCIKDKKH